jgi:hypothetical protein
MNRVLNLSDIEVILSDEESSSVIRGAAQASPSTRARPSPIEQIVRGSLMETYKRCGRPNCHCADGPGHGPKRYLSTIARTGERPRLGYVPNAAYAQVAEFLANFRKLQEMLNEICAINAELLRRRESLD